MPLASGEVPQEVPDGLPLLDAFVEEGPGDGYRLSATAAVLIQHQLGSIVPMTRALLSLGLDPGNLYWVDIPYSANRRVAERLVELGIPSENFAPADYDLEKPYAGYQLTRVTRLVRRLQQRLGPDDRLLVLDDGAYFIESACCFAADFPHLALVEQTRRGMLKLRANPAAWDYAERNSLINVAEARPKLTIEPPFIATSIIRALLNEVANEQDFVAEGPILILGYGAIGRAVAEAIVRDLGVAPADVHVRDPSPTALARAQEEGFTAWDVTVARRPRYRLVLGCSGTTSFGVSDRVYLEDGAILASASSGSAELSREQFVELAEAHAEDDIFIYDRETLSSRSVHSPIRFRLVDRDAVFLNGGFPINFDGRVNCVPFHHIQLTRALMLAGAIQADEGRARGIQPLAAELSDWVTERYTALTGAGEPNPAR